MTMCVTSRDGIKTDKAGNVYSGTGGVSVRDSFPSFAARSRPCSLVSSSPRPLGLFSYSCAYVSTWPLHAGLERPRAHGTLLSKIVLFPPSHTLPSSLPAPNKPRTRYCASFCLCPDGRVCILAKDRVHVARLDSGQVDGSLLPERARG